MNIEALTVRAFDIPTETPEADGTIEWSHTTLVLVEAASGNITGLGFTYADRSTAAFIDEHLRPVVNRANAFDIPKTWNDMRKAIRNQGRSGIASMAIAAVDNALWDLKARLLGISLTSLLGRARDGVPVYGSNGFTNYSLEQLLRHLRAYVDAGIPRIKIKVGEHPEHDGERVNAARKTIGPDTELFVDANGAYTRKQALDFAEKFADMGVTWFEEPVSSDDLEGLRLLRDRAPAGMNITAGEYGYDLPYFRRMLDAGAVDILQADVTRCAGITGFRDVNALCQSRSMPLSGHTSPSQHAAVAASVQQLVHVEYFFDHARIEQMLFHGVITPKNGKLFPDMSAPGNGLTFRDKDAEKYCVYRT